ncbi:M14 family zinc carboxypeptidase [Nocardioides sp. T2.26MG-1]|uniref:M14 family zinc carboxypeptidase n=1 Tax=Nocardioides sp. T2.26MG-1 TaxID=3041166 RepID=UPI0024777C90|nr:M14 family zinc carboxypeptidase [Nocardioides sp. T2.26MG-1]CAI9409450.1 Murein peptide amidase A [Nocardioides sp. T2.26MG-1]
MRLGSLLVTAVTTGLLAGLLAGVPAPSYAVRAPVDRPAVVETRVIGHSVQGRPIKAFRLGERGGPKVLLISTMHGNEGHTRRILESLRDGRQIHGLNLWVLPVYNPDGLARHTRKNARGVDLNRNFPYRWADLDGTYESGPRPGSEPETRAAMRFLKAIRPHWIISFHQPLHGVDTDTKSQRFSRRVADKLNLPRKSFTCGGVCHGTMTSWFNHRFRGSALTAEYGAHPPRRLMRSIAPRQVLSIWGARRQ